MSGTRKHELPFAHMPTAKPHAMTYDPPRSEYLPTSSASVTNRTGFHAWSLSSLWPLLLHCSSALGIACFVLFYVNNNHFNITERNPRMVLGDSTVIHSGRYAPLQSDITTLLSVFLSLSRWVLATWAGALCWYSLFLLMGNVGLPHRDLQWLASYKLFPLRSYFRDPLSFTVGYVLLVTTLIQFTGPVLTGSVTWVPSARPAGLVSRSTVEVSVASASAEWGSYTADSPWRGRVAIQAGGFATIAWGRDLQKGVLKRVLPSTAALNINSTVANVTLPYFSVTALEWIADPEGTLPPYQLIVYNGVDPILSTRPGVETLSMPGTLALIPEANSSWTSSSSWVTRPFPQPSSVSETRTLVVYTGYQLGATDCSDPSLMFSRPLPSIPFHRQGNRCYAYARVTYRAGAGVCENCRLSSNSTVQNDTAISLQAHPLTVEALRLMPDVTSNLVLMNASTPSRWDVFDDYVTEMLVRSYSASWMALVGRTGEWSPKLTTGFSATFPTSRADVNPTRVLIWLLMQLLVTLLGLSFLGFQSSSRYALIGDTTMTPFYLDTTDVTKANAVGKLGVEERLRVEPVGNHWKITIGN